MPSQVGRKNEGHLPEWYNSHDLDDGSGHKKFDGLSDALKQLQAFLNDDENDPFDIIVGHSQGAQLAAILTLMMESDPNWLYSKTTNWRGIVCLNAPNPFDTEVTLVDRVRTHGKLSTPSLHVYGSEKDFTFDGSKKMRSTHFGKSNVWEFTHNEGHFPPRGDEVCKQIVDSIFNMMASIKMVRKSPLLMLVQSLRPRLVLSNQVIYISIVYFRL